MADVEPLEGAVEALEARGNHSRSGSSNARGGQGAAAPAADGASEHLQEDEAVAGILSHEPSTGTLGAPQQQLEGARSLKAKVREHAALGPARRGANRSKASPAARQGAAALGAYTCSD